MRFMKSFKIIVKQDFLQLFLTLLHKKTIFSTYHKLIETCAKTRFFRELSQKDKALLIH
jgi:hypothetical protein